MPGAGPTLPSGLAVPATRAMGHRRPARTIPRPQPPNGEPPMIPQPTPFSLDEAQKAVTTALLNLLKASLGGNSEPDPETAASLRQSIQDALLAGSAACAEIGRMRASLTELRDTHRPQPHADHTQPGALCATCSLDGALIAWPCHTWTAADQILTHGQP